MKYLLFILFFTIGIISCSDENSTNSKNETETALQLNENCSNFKSDSSLLKAIYENNLNLVKELLKKCSLIDSSLFDSLKYDNKYHDKEDVIINSIWNEKSSDPEKRSNPDSLVMYLVENGFDSAAKNLGTIFATEAMKAQDTALVRYAIENNYPISGEIVYWAIAFSAPYELGSETGRYWYNILLNYIPDIDSVGQFGDMPILNEFCGSYSISSLNNLSDDDKLFYFKDLIDKGYSIDRTTVKTSSESDWPTALCACKYGHDSQTELQKNLSDILIAAGADTSFVNNN